MKRRKATTVVAVLAVALFTTGQPVPAQSNCQQAKGLQDAEFDPVTNSNTGHISHGGWLNGTTLDVFRMDILPTGDPTTVTFTGAFTLTTVHGQLKANNVYTYNVVTGRAAILGHIDPTISTGSFAGATGVLYFVGKTVSLSPFVVQAEMSGDICFAQ